MNKQSLDLLEKAFAAEVAGSMGGIYMIQTRSKVAKKLEAEGYLMKVERVLGGKIPVTLKGYRLTLKGNAAYCLSDRCTNPLEEN